MKVKELVSCVNLEGIEMKYSYLMESKEYNNETVYGIVAKRESIENGKVVNSIEEEKKAMKVSLFIYYK